MVSRVSIILLSWNHEDFVADAIESVLEQTFQDFELIVIDDLSSDGSWEIIQGFDDNRIRAFQNPKRMRGAVGLNRGISELASGEFVAIHHSDDMFRPDKIAKQVDFLDQNQNVGAVFTNVQLIDDTGNPFANAHHPYFSVFDSTNRSRFDWLNRFFYHSNCLCHPSVMVRRSCYERVGTYDRRFGQLGDLNMWVRICLVTEIHVLEEKLTKFRILPRNLNTSGDKPENHIRVLSEVPLLLRHYLQIPESEIFAVLPDARGWSAGENYFVPYLVARLALAQPNRTHRIFGLNTLYDLFGSSDTAGKIEEIHGFSFIDLVELAADMNVYGYRDRSRIKKLRSYTRKLMMR